MNENIPRHIGIIMDGNGRWARRKGLPRVSGHQAGVDSVDEIVSACRAKGVRYLTLYSFSKENWQRPKGEVSFLMDLLSKYMQDRLNKMLANDIRFNCIGTLNDLPKRIQDQIQETVRNTAHGTSLTLTLALSYGGRQEIVDAVKAMCESVQRGDISIQDISPDLFSRFLYTKSIPDPDLVIRTSGEFRLSNFLLWQSSYAELFVSPKLWPDFKEADLEEAIAAYGKRERRFGNTHVTMQST